MNRKWLVLILTVFCQIYSQALSQQACPVDACVTADPNDNLGLIMATNQATICDPPISCYASNNETSGSGSPGASGTTGSGHGPTMNTANINFGACKAGDAVCAKNLATYKKQFITAIKNLNAIAANLPAGPARDRIYSALESLTAGNMVTIVFASLDGVQAGDTKSVGDGSQYGSKFIITFDMSKITDIATLTIDAAHEGTHASDLTLATQGAFPKLTSLFQVEYRAYEVSAWTAQDFSVNKLTYSDGVTIWDNTWPADQQAALIDQNVTQHIVNTYPNDPEHAPVTPHDPYPNQ